MAKSSSSKTHCFEHCPMETEMDNLSIHPRSWPHQRDSERKNTCGHKKRSTVQRAINGLTHHAEQHPACVVTRTHLAKKLKAIASMPADKTAQA